MKELTVNELYTLDETIAKDLFEGVTYPWEVLPKISAFILELGATLSEEEYEKRERMSGLQNPLQLHRQLTSTDRLSLGKMRK